MTFPFSPDPIPPGHGETATVERGTDRTYVVLVALVIGGPESVESRWGDLKKALEERDRVRDELVLANYRNFHVGVMDDDDPERGYIEEDE